jgi:alkanesulfonate monooxygenase SsuD/methylene tetrahydromethanopterin reductase-like flavin-dependent oxidoreductase (luciferase family)
MAQQIELGLDTFGDIQAGPDGQALTHAQVIRNVIDESVLADEVGVYCIGLGEHHRPDFAISSPEVLLGAIAARTRRIHLASSVTELSSDDPIRVFQRFSTVNAISSGRAEVILGRGSFTESFPLFGYELSNYETLFDDKLDLFAAILKNEPVTWRGQTRPPLTNQRIFPPIENGTLKTWIGVGGSPESVVRAAHYDLPLMLAIIGGDPSRFRPFVDLYHRAFAQFGRPVREIGAHSHGYVAETDDKAREELWPDYKKNARPDRRRTRLAAHDSRAIRQRNRTWLALCRRSGNGRASDRHDSQSARRFAFSHEIQRRNAVTRKNHALHRALWPQGDPAYMRYARVSAAPVGAESFALASNPGAMHLDVVGIDRNQIGAQPRRDSAKLRV